LQQFWGMGIVPPYLHAEAPLDDFINTADSRGQKNLAGVAAGPSWQSRCTVDLLRPLGIKKKLASAAVVQEHVRRLALRPASYEPTVLGRGVEVTLKHLADGNAATSIPITANEYS
jgi:hypothetical protein